MGFLGTLVKTLQGNGRLSARPDMGDYYRRNWHWDRSSTTAEGRFRTAYCAPKGKFIRHHDGTFDLYIYDPPEVLWDHPRKKCFIPTQQKGEYRVNFVGLRSAQTYDGCVMEVERILVQAFTRRS
jgi:hypothetical protein